MNTTFYTNAEFLQPDQSLRFKLKYLLLSHTAQEVHTTLRNIFEEDYSFYQSLFSFTAPAPIAAPIPAPAPVAAPLTPVVAQESTLRPPKSRPDMKIRIVKKAAAEPEPEPEKVSVEVSSDKEKKALIKKEQAEKVKEKNAELVAKGIDPSTLMTKGNLKQWVEVEALTYAQIAREHVGLPADQIATISKGYGFQSPIVKKRAMLFSKK
jgi:hypothetical protein